LKNELQATCPDAKYRDGKQAVENAKKAFRLCGGRNWLCLDALAAAYAESGDFKQARTWQAMAVALAMANKSVLEKDRQEAHAHLELYKQGKPCREKPMTRPAAGNRYGEDSTGL
jgi:hypothetical protein